MKYITLFIALITTTASNYPMRRLLPQARRAAQRSCHTTPTLGITSIEKIKALVSNAPHKPPHETAHVLHQECKHDCSTMLALFNRKKQNFSHIPTVPLSVAKALILHVVFGENEFVKEDKITLLSAFLERDDMIYNHDEYADGMHHVFLQLKQIKAGDDILYKPYNHIQQNLLHVFAEYHSTCLFETLHTYYPELNLNIKDGQGNMPLHIAAAHGNLHTVQYLCEHGAYITTRNDRGLKPAEIALQNGFASIYTYLLSQEELPSKQQLDE